MNFEALLKKLVRNRYKDDLHSGMFYFKSGRVAYIQAYFNKNIGVTLRDEDKQVDCTGVSEVLALFEGDELLNYEI